MNNAPRASLSITILGDEDYRVLMTARGGLEAFGVFVAMLIVGRERLQQGQGTQVSESGLPSDKCGSLKLSNSVEHLLSQTYVTPKQFYRAIELFAHVAKETHSKPWMYLDKTSHLVIRSFFKFNTTSGWGGPRTGAGRPPKAPKEEIKSNQDDSENNHLEKSLVLALVLDDVDTGAGARTRGPDPEPTSAAPPVPLPPTDPNIRRIADMADALAPSEDLGSKVAGWCAGYPTEWVEDAIRYAWVSAKPGGRASYANGCLIRWRHRGGPPQAEVEKARRAIPTPEPFNPPPHPNKPVLRAANGLKENDRR